MTRGIAKSASAAVLKQVVTLFGVVCTAIALAHVAFGPQVIVGSIPVNATMDSEDRFYATLFLGFGLALIWCSRDLTQRSRLFAALLIVFFAGGMARLISVAAVGWPHDLFVVLGALELSLPPLLWWWHVKMLPIYETRPLPIDLKRGKGTNDRD